ncbi:hypothetical protein C0992_008101, partial [Termitomyces sp. T32_za158]
TYLSEKWCGILVSNGIYACDESASLQRNEGDISKQLLSGRSKGLTRSKTPKNCTENFYTPLWWPLQDVHTSPAWNPSWGCSLTVLSCHGLPQGELPKTYSGGNNYYLNQWRDQFWRHSPQSISKHIQTPAPASGLASPSGRSGGPGSWNQDGKQTAETLAGQKPSASCSSYLPSSRKGKPGEPSKLSGTTKALWKDGGWAGAETAKSMRSSSKSMPKSNCTGSQYSLDMYRASLTRQTAHREEYSGSQSSSYLQPPYLHLSSPSSSTLSNQVVTQSTKKAISSIDYMEKKLSGLVMNTEKIQKTWNSDRQQSGSVSKNIGERH